LIKGIIAIQALTGKNPMELEEDEQGEIIWPDNAQVSPFLKAIISKMVRNRYQQRYHSAQDVLDVLRRLKSQIYPDQSNQFTNRPSEATRIISPDNGSSTAQTSETVLDQDQGNTFSDLPDTVISKQDNSSPDTILSKQDNSSLSEREVKPKINWLKSPIFYISTITISLGIFVSGLILFRYFSQPDNLISELNSLYQEKRYQKCFEKAKTANSKNNISQEGLDYLGKCGLAEAERQAQLANYTQAAAIASEIPPRSNSYSQAQQKVNEWSKIIFAEAKNFYEKNCNLEQAIAKIEEIPEKQRENYQTKVAIWKRQDQDDKQNISLAEQLLLSSSESDWVKAYYIAEELSQNPCLQNRAKEIMAQAKKQLCPDDSVLCTCPGPLCPY
jgi:serine/threonine-protein kinase